MEHNRLIKQYLVKYGVMQRDLAAALHVHESTVSRWLNKKELSEELQTALISLIRKLAQNKESDDNGK